MKPAIPSKPAAPAADPSAPLAERLYGFGVLEQAINQRAPDLWKHTGAGEQEHRQLRDTFVGIAKAGVPDVVTRAVAESYIDAEIGAAGRTAADTDAATRALEQQIGVWDGESREQLRLAYGSQAEDLLVRTRRYVASVPALRTILNTHGLGSRPEVVQALAHHVFITGYR